MTAPVTLDTLESLRDQRYHRTSALRAHTEEQALDYLNEVGFGYLFSEKTVEMPTLWAAIVGSRRAVPSSHSDPDIGRAWSWKDTLPTRGAVHYGKLLRGKPTFVSLELLPTFYALSPNFGEIDDYLEQYRDGRLGVDAKSLYEALLNEGAMATTRLRQLAGLGGGGDCARRFDRAIAELQAELKIVKVGIADTNRWGYAYVYDLFLRRYPGVPAQARAISTDRAMEALLLRYLRNVVAQPEAMARRVFRWEPWEWDRLMARLRARRALREVAVEGEKTPWLAEATVDL